MDPIPDWGLVIDLGKVLAKNKNKGASKSVFFSVLPTSWPFINRIYFLGNNYTENGFAYVGPIKDFS